MNDNIRFEIKAEAFLRMTGMLAPGKDARDGPSYNDRMMAWERWQDNHKTVIFAMLDAVEHVLDLVEE